MANAYFLNGSHVPIALFLNTTGPPKTLLGLDLLEQDSERKKSQVTVFPMDCGVAYKPDIVGYTNVLKVVLEKGSQYSVGITINADIMNRDLQFTVFADGVLGCQNGILQNISIEQAETG